MVRELTLTEFSTPALFDQIAFIKDDDSLTELEKLLRLEAIEDELDLREDQYTNRW